MAPTPVTPPLPNAPVCFTRVSQHVGLLSPARLAAEGMEVSGDMFEVRLEWAEAPDLRLLSCPSIYHMLWAMRACAARVPHIHTGGPPNIQPCLRSCPLLQS